MIYKFDISNHLHIDRSVEPIILRTIVKHGRRFAKCCFWSGCLLGALLIADIDKKSKCIIIV
jgi:hypothetical protein